MTPPRTRGTQSSADGLGELFPNALYDLTATGFQRAVVELRRSDPTRAARILRSAAPRLRNVFRLRQVPWQDTSVGLRARLLLLDQNPHLARDAEEARVALGLKPEPASIPEPEAIDAFLRATEKWAAKPRWASDASAVRRVAEAQRAGDWLAGHRRIALGQPCEPELDLAGVSPTALLAAESSAQVDLNSPLNPSWMRGTVSDEAPVDHVVARLCDRHRLPPTSEVRAHIANFLLTANESHLRGIRFSDALVALAAIARTDSWAHAYDSFDITVGGIDEYITQDDWMAIYSDWIRPRQARRLEQRGSQPHGRRRVDLQKLIDAVPVYREMVLKHLSLDEALHSVEQGGGGPYEKSDRTAGRQMAELDLLLTPAQVASDPR